MLDDVEAPVWYVEKCLDPKKDSHSAIILTQMSFSRAKWLTGLNYRLAETRREINFLSDYFIHFRFENISNCLSRLAELRENYKMDFGDRERAFPRDSVRDAERIVLDANELDCYDGDILDQRLMEVIYSVRRRTE